MATSVPKTGGVTTPSTVGMSTPPTTSTPPLSFSSTPKTTTTPTVTPTPAPAPTTTPTTTKQPTTTTNPSIQAGIDAAYQEALRIKAELDKLSAAQKPATPTTSYVASSDNIVANENTIKSEVQKLSVPSANEEEARKASADYQKILDDQITRLETQRANELKVLNEQFDYTQKQLEKGQNKETGFTATTLQRIGGFLGPSASAIGALNTLAESHRTEVTLLSAKRAEAINAANNAINNRQYELAQAKAKEAKDLEETIVTRRQSFFDNSIKLAQEVRQQEEEARLSDAQRFKNSLETIERVTPTLINSIEGLSSDEARSYLATAALDLRLDPNLLIGEVNAVLEERRQVERKEVITLAQKYPSASIDPNTDDFVTASEKVRGSREYSLDIAKAEADLTNTRSLINSRAANESIDYSDPVLALYSQATGEILSSPTKARSIMGYADNLLAGKEIVANDFQGPLLENQITESDAKKLLADSFAQFNKDGGEIPESTVWQWLATDDAASQSDEQKKAFIMGAGHNPEDFGIY